MHSGAGFVDSWGVGGINESWARFVRVLMNSEKWYVIYLLHIIDIQTGFYYLQDSF